MLEKAKEFRNQMKVCTIMYILFFIAGLGFTTFSDIEGMGACTCIVGILLLFFGGIYKDMDNKIKNYKQ